MNPQPQPAPDIGHDLHKLFEAISDIAARPKEDVQEPQCLKDLEIAVAQINRLLSQVRS